MQTQLRIYRKSERIDEFAINAHDGKYQTSTRLTESVFETIDDPAGKVAKAVTLLIKIIEDGYKIAVLIPVHQSDDWEVVKISDEYTVAYYCILSEQNSSGA